MSVATCARVSGRRAHLHHGPIDLIVDIDGPDRAVEAAFRAVEQRFATLLDELVPELARLRSETVAGTRFRSAVGERMQRAAERFLPVFTTPMIAVAGSVAEEICATAARQGALQRVIVNNGGDIAFHLAPGESARVGIAAGLHSAQPIAVVTLDSGRPPRGLATSGWRGRSHSLGIADSVTTIAATASMADVAATLVANAVDLPGHPAVRRRPAVELDESSDLGTRLVTVDVDAARLTPGDVTSAIDAGARFASSVVGDGLIEGTAIVLAGRLVTVGRAPLDRPGSGGFDPA